MKVLNGLILGMPAIEGSILEGKMSWDLKMMSAIKCALHRGLFIRV